MTLTWLVLGLEVVGIMAVVFATGIGIGFFASWLLRRGEPKRQKAPAPRPVPARVPTYIGVDPTMPEPPPEPKPGPKPEPQPVTEAKQDTLPEPIVFAPPPEPSFQTIPEFRLAATMRFPLNSFGRVSITRPDPDQPSS